MTEVGLRKEFGALRPESEDAARVLGRIANGTYVVADVKDHTRRSVKQHNYYFAIVDLMFDNQGAYKTKTQFRAVIQARLGFADIIETPAGRVLIPQSIKFNAMPANEFHTLVEGILDIAETEMGFDKETLRAEVSSRYGDPYPTDIEGAGDD